MLVQCPVSIVQNHKNGVDTDTPSHSCGRSCKGPVSNCWRFWWTVSVLVSAERSSLPLLERRWQADNHRQGIPGQDGTRTGGRASLYWTRAVRRRRRAAATASASRRRRFCDVFTSSCTPAICCYLSVMPFTMYLEHWQKAVRTTRACFAIALDTQMKHSGVRAKVFLLTILWKWKLMLKVSYGISLQI